ncbi:hypothetical protein ACRAWF_39630 [Streptomyces sp. L7]
MRVLATEVNATVAGTGATAERGRSGPGRTSCPGPLPGDDPAAAGRWTWTLAAPGAAGRAGGRCSSPRRWN